MYEIIFNSWVQSDFYFFSPFQETAYLKMFRRYHSTFSLKDRIFYSELSVLHKFYMFLCPKRTGPDTPSQLLTCSTLSSLSKSLSMLVTKLAYSMSYDGASKQPAPRQSLHVPKVAPLHSPCCIHPPQASSRHTKPSTPHNVLPSAFRSCLSIPSTCLLTSSHTYTNAVHSAFPTSDVCPTQLSQGVGWLSISTDVGV